jgi:trans-aconitate methyltransferase
VPRQPLRVAELGCCGGVHLDAMATAWPAAELIGYDSDPVALALAAERLGWNPRIRLRQVDARGVADDGLFDLALAADALHDMPDAASVLNAARERAGQRRCNSDRRSAISIKVLRPCGSG